jgi:hypothetical protein
VFIHVLFMNMFLCFQLDLLFCLEVWILQAGQLFHKKIALERNTNFSFFIYIRSIPFMVIAYYNGPKNALKKSISTFFWCCHHL